MKSDGVGSGDTVGEVNVTNDGRRIAVGLGGVCTLSPGLSGSCVSAGLEVRVGVEECIVDTEVRRQVNIVNTYSRVTITANSWVPQYHGEECVHNYRTAVQKASE